MRLYKLETGGKQGDLLIDLHAIQAVEDIVEEIESKYTSCLYFTILLTGRVFTARWDIYRDHDPENPKNYDAFNSKIINIHQNLITAWKQYLDSINQS